MSEPHREVVVVIDLSNILIGAHAAAEAFPGGEDCGSRVHVCLEQLYRYAHADRPVRRAVIAASDRPSTRTVLDRAARLRPAADVIALAPDPKTNREVGVDDALIDAMDQCLDDPPATLVLVSGDGGRRRTGEGFVAAAQRLVQRGWGIEILSWRHAAHADLRRLQTQHETVAFLELDEQLEAITHHPGRPASGRLDLCGRPLASPRRRHTLRSLSYSAIVDPQPVVDMDPLRGEALRVLAEMQDERRINPAQVDAFGRLSWRLTPDELAVFAERFGEAA